MAYDLAVEGEDGPFAGAVLSDVARCGPDEGVQAVRQRLRSAGDDHAIVVDATAVVLGRVSLETLDGAGDDMAVADVMSLSPTTVRPSVPAEDLAERGEDEVVITSSDGRLIGVVRPESLAHDDRPEEHQRLERQYLEVAMAVKERFGEEEPDEDELRAFLRERLIAKGRTPEEADDFLTEMNQP